MDARYQRRGKPTGYEARAAPVQALPHLRDCALSGQPARTVAVFDLDGTLTRRDTSLPFLRSVGGIGPVTAGVLAACLWGLPDLIGAFVAERWGRGPRVGHTFGRWEGRLHERVTRVVLRGISRSDLTDAAERFGGRLVANMLRPDMREILEGHRACGHLTVVASASLEVVLLPLRSLLGVDEVVGTRLVYDGDRATGFFSGVPCWGEEKARRVREVLAPAGKVELHAYGDSRGDRALLEMADHAQWVG